MNDSSTVPPYPYYHASQPYSHQYHQHPPQNNVPLNAQISEKFATGSVSEITTQTPVAFSVFPFSVVLLWLPSTDVDYLLTMAPNGTSPFQIILQSAAICMSVHLRNFAGHDLLAIQGMPLEILRAQLALHNSLDSRRTAVQHHYNPVQQYSVPLQQPGQQQGVQDGGRFFSQGAAEVDHCNERLQPNYYGACTSHHANYDGQGEAAQSTELLNSFENGWQEIGSEEKSMYDKKPMQPTKNVTRKRKDQDTHKNISSSKDNEVGSSKLNKKQDQSYRSPTTASEIKSNQEPRKESNVNPNEDDQKSHFLDKVKEKEKVEHSPQQRKCVVPSIGHSEIEGSETILKFNGISIAEFPSESSVEGMGNTDSRSSSPAVEVRVPHATDRASRGVFAQEKMPTDHSLLPNGNTKESDGDKMISVPSFVDNTPDQPKESSSGANVARENANSHSKHGQSLSSGWRKVTRANKCITSSREETRNNERAASSGGPEPREQNTDTNSMESMAGKYHMHARSSSGQDGTPHQRRVARRGKSVNGKWNQKGDSGSKRPARRKKNEVAPQRPAVTAGEHITEHAGHAAPIETDEEDCQRVSAGDALLVSHGSTQKMEAPLNGNGTPPDASE